MQGLSIINIDQLLQRLPADEMAHQLRVGALVGLLSSKFFNDLEVRHMEEAAFYHDIGKIYVPPMILTKNGKLNRAELEIIKLHPFYAQTIFDCINDGKITGFKENLYQSARESALYHHERWDGNGYPFRLAGLQIPLIGRITALCDAYDAISSQRSYKTAMKHEQACKELERCADTQFDPKLVRAFLKNESEFKILRNRYLVHSLNE